MYRYENSYLAYSFIFSDPCDQVNCGRGTCKAQNHEGLCSCFQGYSLVNGKCIDVDECTENPCHNTAMWVISSFHLEQILISNFFLEASLLSNIIDVIFSL